MSQPTRRRSLQTKLFVTILAAGLIPAGVIGWQAYQTAGGISKAIAHEFQVDAEAIGDKVDRNLFERYGDVQAFGANEAVQDRKSWYQVGSESNKLAAVANRYANLYGFYLLSVVVDLDGRVIAVNDKDPAGKPINTTHLYHKNFKDAPWFKDALAGKFLKSDVLDGTVVEDLYVDEDVKKAYSSEGLVLGFSAPIKDGSGKVIGVWNNRANFALVEEIVVDSYRALKVQGLDLAELTLLDKAGRVLVDFDPAGQGGKEEVRHDLNVLLNLNLAEKGVAAAQDLVAGKTGNSRALHVRKGIWQIAGYARCNGALGFSGLGWGVLVRAPESQALAQQRAELVRIVLILVASVVVLVGAALWLGRSLSRPLLKGMEVLQDVSVQVAGAAAQLSRGSQSLAEGASEQAASLEETSASLEEMSSMATRNTESAQSAKNAANQTRTVADSGVESVQQMGEAITGIQQSTQEMKAAIGAIQLSGHEVSKIVKTIDEIAFQTNILALNAAVEAARAGEAGLGFAVVADEVRNLAQRSAKAAKETAEKIDDSLRKGEEGVRVSERVTESSRQVEVKAGLVGASLQEIVGKIRQLDETMAQVAAASKEQNDGVKQINAAVSQMDKTTQTTAATAEESASASEELNAQALSLRDTISRLRTLITGGIEGAPSGNGSTSTHAGGTRGSGPAPTTVSSSGSKNDSNGTAAPRSIPMPSHEASRPADKTGAQRDFRDF